MRLSENLARGAECPSRVQDCLSFVSAFGLVQFGADAAAYMHVSIGEEMEWKWPEAEEERQRTNASSGRSAFEIDQSGESLPSAIHAITLRGTLVGARGASHI